MKRVYKSVSTDSAANGFLVRLDGRELKSPAKASIILPTRALADAIAAEWNAQETDIQPDSMPLMQLAATAVDLIGPKREEIVAALAAYAETDLVCYRAEAPQRLTERQAAHWQPLLDWIAERYDVTFAVHTGIMPRPQPQTTLAAMRKAVAAHNDWALSAMQTATGEAGSLVVALALLNRRIDAEAAFQAAQIDETHQIEQWGEDTEAAARRRRLAADLAVARRFVDLLDA